ncbi:hypothetical protein [Pseudosporangium ferrugineum]|uniref:LppP/LprE lipoprotein n=1 Tax=Pseudosporangium ferrugineum TaxID=439699 RepID=A0A2T0SFQ4_9ACTN|nr:hypothetical protein [Pseudosporangium ferrugineum]PRY32241.1 hypothetical protein CLV70_102452 [Pseudosporangium ferrugineum]
MPIRPLWSAKRTAIGTLLLVSATAGCGSEAPPTFVAAAPSATPSSAASPSSIGDAAPSPTAGNTRKAKPRTSKKSKAPSGGGTEFPGCADGDCKVAFSGSVEFSLRDWTVSAFLENGGVKARLTKPNGWGGGGGYLAGPGCALEIHADGGARLGCDRAPAKPKSGGYVVQLLKLDGRAATIRATLG